MSKIKIKGVVPALVSPLNDDGSIREDPLRKLIKWQISHGINGLYVCGTTGEGILMQPRYRKELLEIVLDEAGGRIPVIAHIGALDMTVAADLAKHAEKAGASVVSSIPPIYFSYSEDEIYEYYSTLAAASNLPMLMYGIPLAGNNLSLHLVERLMQIENMVGIKWTYMDYFTLQRIKTINNGDINVVNGPDECLLCGLAMGADAGIGSTYNIMPGLFVSLYRHFTNGEIDKAREMQYAINTVIAALFRHGIFPSIKVVLESLGFDVGNCSLPMKRLSKEERETLLNEIQQVDLVNQRRIPT
ncbi:MAG: dihydrodipicolinate synthase family protein [Clostridiaceae bacterium]|nr:dihydrodipicolinate synthase family protein [Clostridiaceae bacterium]